MTSYDLSEYKHLKVWAEMFFDAQQARIRSSNRVSRAPVFPDLFAEELAVAEETEKRIGRHLIAQYRHTVPAGVIAWQKGSHGIGEHTVARLLGHLGHPLIAEPSHWEGVGTERKLVVDQPYKRTLSQLRQYCGHGDQGRRQTHMTPQALFALGNPTLKMIVHLISECAVKQPGRRIAELLAQQPSVPAISIDRPVAERSTPQPEVGPLSRDITAGEPSTTPPTSRPESIDDPVVWPYRQIYEERRLVTFGRLHADPCVRCGPSGKPAMSGSPWSDGHAQADALRIVGKEILRDIWLASEDEEETSD